MSLNAAWDLEEFPPAEPYIEAATTVDTEVGADKQWRIIWSQLTSLELLEEGWDGENAPLIDQAVLESTEILLKSFRQWNNDPPSRIVPTAEGGLLIVWRTHDKYLELEIEEPYRGEYMEVRKGMEPFHDIYEWGRPFVRNSTTLNMWPEQSDYSVVEGSKIQTASAMD